MGYIKTKRYQSEDTKESTLRKAILEGSDGSEYFPKNRNISSWLQKKEPIHWEGIVGSNYPVIDIIFSLPPKEKFEFYKKKWMENTKYSSTIREIVADENYYKIIDLGFSIIPYIFKELENENLRRHWISALYKITGANPVKPDHLGNIDAITQDWIEWGKISKYI